MCFLPSNQPLIRSFLHRNGEYTLFFFIVFIVFILFFLSILLKHFTATAFVVNSRNQCLLLWHKRLKRWMPPGGHVDADEMPEETARRECKEETGMDVEIVGELQEDLFQNNPDEGCMMKKPVALLLENIPASTERNEPAHQHMDFVYLARPLDERQTLTLLREEGTDLRWFTRKEVEALDPVREIFANVQAYILRILPRKTRQNESTNRPKKG